MPQESDLPLFAAEPEADEDSADASLETVGVETELDLGDVSSLDFKDVVLAPSDWTVQTILSQMQSNSFELDPDFQRRNAWTDNRKSKFIESLILGLPIPQIVLAEKERPDGFDSYIVIDGKQRLLALEAFFSLDAPLVLTGLTVLHDLNGHSRSELLEDPSAARLVSRLDNRTIRTVVIRRWNDDSFLHLVFHRINHQTLALSAQELRQALNPGEFTRFADRFAGDSELLHRALGASQRPDFRMRDVELLVRHLAFKFRLTSYKGNLKKFLDDTCAEFNAAWIQDSGHLEAAARGCDAAIQATFEIFGEHAFRRYAADRGWESRFNRAVFDVLVFYFAEPNVREASLAQPDLVRQAFERLSERDPEFSSSVLATTKTTRSTGYRLGAWGRALASALGLVIDTPRVTEDNRSIEYRGDSAR